MAVALMEARDTFTRAMSFAMAGFEAKKEVIYLDDLMIYGEILNDDKQRLHRILKHLVEANWS